MRAFATSVAERYFKERVIAVDDMTRGCDHFVFRVRSAHRTVVVRLPKSEPRKLAVHAGACRLWSSVGVPVPIQFVTSARYSIESFVDGKEMEFGPSTCARLGVVLKKMHGVRVEGFGQLTRDMRGRSKSWYAYLERDFSGCMRHIKRTGMLDGVTRARIAHLFDTYTNYLRSVNKSVLLHGDLGAEHILMNRGEVVGIIDAADAMAGDGLYDIGVLFYDSPQQFSLNHFERGYGDVDHKLVVLYAVLAKLWHLTSGDAAKTAKKIKRILGCLNS